METTHSSGGAFSVADGITRIILIGLAFLFPLFIIPLPFVDIPQGKALILSIGFILAALVWACARLLEGVLHVPRSWLVYVSALLPIAYLISTLVSGWNSSALVGAGIEQDTLVAVTLMCALFFITAFAFFGNLAGIWLLIQGSIVGLAVLFALETLYIFFPQWFSLGVLAGQTANPFGSWHDLGILAGLSLFLSLALGHSTFFAGWKKSILIILGALSAFLLIVIHFNDIFWGVAILSVIVAIATFRASRVAGESLRHSIRSVAPWIACAVILALCGAFGTKIWDKLPAPIHIVQTEVRPSWQGTFDIAKQSLISPAQFVFGAGPNSFIKEWGLHKPESVNATPFWDSDFNTGVGNIPTSLFTAGAVGFVAWAAILIVLLSLLWRLLREPRPFTHTRSTLGILLLSVAYLIVYHMIYTPGIALTAGTFIALGLLALSSAGDAPSIPLRLSTAKIGDGIRLALFVIIVLAALAASGLIAREVISNIFVNKAAYIYQTSNNVTKAGQTLSLAFLISPNNDRAHRAAAELGIIELSQLIPKTDPNNKEAAKKLQDTLQNTIQHGLSAVSIDLGNYQNWLLLAQVYGNLAGVNIQGAYEQAKNAYEKAFAAHPTNPTPKFRLAQLAIAKGDYVSARTDLQTAITLKPDFAAAYFLLSQVEASDGKGDAAVQAASNAVQLVPQDPLGWFNLGYILHAGQSYQNAAQALAQAVQLTPDYSNALFYLGLSLYQLGNKVDAVTAFDRVAQLNPQETWVAQISANIRAGKEPMAGIQQAQK